MKHVTILLSFYILTLAFAPAVKILHNHLSGQMKICNTKTGAEDHSGHHHKQHCSTFVCFNKAIFVSLPNNIISIFSPGKIARHQFSHQDAILLLYPIEIWQPPKIA